jgi:hypothetical protein
MASTPAVHVAVTEKGPAAVGRIDAELGASTDCATTMLRCCRPRPARPATGDALIHTTMHQLHRDSRASQAVHHQWLWTVVDQRPRWLLRDKQRGARLCAQRQAAGHLRKNALQRRRAVRPTGADRGETRRGIRQHEQRWRCGRKGPQAGETGVESFHRYAPPARGTSAEAVEHVQRVDLRAVLRQHEPVARYPGREHRHRESAGQGAAIRRRDLDADHRQRDGAPPLTPSSTPTLATPAACTADVVLRQVHPVALAERSAPSLSISDAVTAQGLSVRHRKRWVRQRKAVCPAARRNHRNHVDACGSTVVALLAPVTVATTLMLAIPTHTGHHRAARYRCVRHDCDGGVDGRPGKVVEPATSLSRLSTTAVSGIVSPPRPCRRSGSTPAYRTSPPRRSRRCRRYRHATARAAGWRRSRARTTASAAACHHQHGDRRTGEPCGPRTCPHDDPPCSLGPFPESD